MRKNRIFVLEILAMVLVFGLVFIGCDLNKGPPTGKVTVTIKNNSSYVITAYRVETHAGFASSEYSYAYTSAGFVYILNGSPSDYHDPFERFDVHKNLGVCVFNRISTALEYSKLKAV